MADLVPPLAIRAGVTLGLFDTLENSPARADVVGERLHLSAPKVLVLLSVLEELKLVQSDSDHRYQLTAIGQCLVRGGNGVSRTLDLSTALGQYEFSVVDLVDVLQGEYSYFTSRFGKDYWQLVDSSSEDRSLVAAMSSPTATFDAEQLVHDELWSSVEKVIDLGGGNGNVLIALAENNPNIQGLVFDLPGRVESAHALICEHGLASRIDVMGGNFFNQIPRGFECYLLNAILADWSDDQNINLLAGIRRSMPGTGTLVISEVDPAATLGSPRIHLKMICAAEGWIRTPREVLSLAMTAGFELVRSSSSPSRFTQIYKPL